MGDASADQGFLNALQTIHARHLQIQEQTGEAVIRRPFEERVRRRKGFDREAVRPQHPLDRFQHQGIVINDEDTRLLVHRSTSR